MNRFSILVACAVLLSLPSVAAPDKMEHYVSTEISPDQIAVYSFILKSYRTLLKPIYRDMLAKAFYLEKETEPLDVKELKPRRGCLKGLEFERIPREQVPSVHRLSEQKWLPSYVKLTSGAPCRGSPLEDMCYETEGTLSLTEILFDKSHTHAIVGFGVHCGPQCGWGQIAVLEKLNGNWQKTNLVCGEWYI
jgi:hypothetical protein